MDIGKRIELRSRYIKNNNKKLQGLNSYSNSKKYDKLSGAYQFNHRKASKFRSIEVKPRNGAGGMSYLNSKKKSKPTNKKTKVGFGKSQFEDYQSRFNRLISQSAFRRNQLDRYLQLKKPYKRTPKQSTRQGEPEGGNELFEARFSLSSDQKGRNERSRDRTTLVSKKSGGVSTNNFVRGLDRMMGTGLKPGQARSPYTRNTLAHLGSNLINRSKQRSRNKKSGLSQARSSKRNEFSGYFNRSPRKNKYAGDLTKSTKNSAKRRGKSIKYNHLWTSSGRPNPKTVHNLYKSLKPETFTKEKFISSQLYLKEYAAKRPKGNSMKNSSRKNRAGGEPGVTAAKNSSLLREQKFKRSPSKKSVDAVWYRKRSEDNEENRRKELFGLKHLSIDIDNSHIINQDKEARFEVKERISVSDLTNLPYSFPPHEFQELDKLANFYAPGDEQKTMKQRLNLGKLKTSQDTEKLRFRNSSFDKTARSQGLKDFTESSEEEEQDPEDIEEIQLADRGETWERNDQAQDLNAVFQAVSDLIQQKNVKIEDLQIENSILKERVRDLEHLLAKIVPNNRFEGWDDSYEI